MNKSSGDGECSKASFLHTGLSKLVIWAHSHGTICNEIPALEFIENTGHLSKDNAMLWMCRVGHAYHWQYEKLHDRDREGTEAAGRKRRPQFSEASAREESFGEKRLRLTPSSFERGQADVGSTGSCGRSPGVTQQKADTAYTRHKKPSPRGSQNTRELMTSCSAAEQHLAVAGLQTGGQNMKLKDDDDVLIISDEEQCVAVKDNQGDRINQNNVSEPPTQVGLRMLHCQELAFHQPTAPQRSALAHVAGPPLAHAYVLQSPVSNLEDPGRNILRSGHLTAAGPTAETSRARNPPGSAAPKVCFKPLPVSNTEAKAQLESCPLVTFFKFQATADVQQQLQLSPPKHGLLGVDSSRNGTENLAEESEPSGSRQAPHPSAFQSPESHPPAASNRGKSPCLAARRASSQQRGSRKEPSPPWRGVLQKQEKKKNCPTGDIKVFKDWLMLHHPSETREIHTLPPEDLDRYLVSFFSSTKRQDGTDFSAHSFGFLQRSIERYLKEHSYQYNVVRGLEFRASQEAWKLKHQCLFQKKREEEWSILENLTDEDVENLRKKGILNRMDPQGFLHLMFTSIVRGFGASTHSQSHHLYWGQLVLRKSEGEVEYLEWKDDLSPEGNKGESSPRLFAKPADPENCPVTSYKEYARRRPPDSLNDSDALYLAPRSQCSSWDEVWYFSKPLTRAKMEKILKVITQQIRGAVRKPRQ
ncbi:uncharacterized protein LOC116799316 isoform X1 [Chiroxiphia lanceolata]|uniref:uncharacterized protein LOC116799316 isoform X1 n=2 Tax=Chiroxiphia lanceolata TaxID=296741 RepID=UPI0013CEF9C1|nr:uncharacterized protein LOC116799316 isoform X1 [Chiroxiphia lanceolata]XP_032568253.1 uncharacterized protein LOC116799316 isoform X1 [Chiroxiphia lanceolata]XP_032568254.1 uncharacterized protein LOC116799316 isoform X1 [Chiroxiphia lanceolata]XP_032568255.1 uncharacterized protein LOC116799316 isoform X1 [Chiroxiphia lanceolata]